MFRILIVTFIALCIEYANAGIVIGAFDATRTSTYSLKNLGLADLITSRISGSSFVEGPMLTDSFLSGLDVLVLTSNTSFTTSSSPLTPSEQAALLTYIGHGGGVVAVTSDEPSFMAPFGMVISRDSRSNANHSSIPNYLTNPISNGPYGTTSTFTTDVFGGANNIFATLGPYAHGIGFNSYGLPTLAQIDENVISPGSGRVVLFADPESALESFITSNGLALNAIAYVAVPETSTMVMMSLVAAIGATSSVLRKGFVRK